MADPFIGQIQCFALNFAPRGWVKCDGQLLLIAQHTALFSLLGTNFGGDGRTTFGVPNLMGRTNVSSGRGPGLSDYRLGTKGGAETVGLSTGQIPGHFHGTSPAVADIDGDQASPANNYPASMTNAYFGSTNASMGESISGNTGNNQPHENMQPFLVNMWCLSLDGTYPQRG